MADQDYTQDKGFMAASPEDQHAYLMHADPGYAKASPEDQKSYLAHLRGSAPEAPKPTTANNEVERTGGNEGFLKKVMRGGALGAFQGAGVAESQRPVTDTAKNLGHFAKNLVDLIPDDKDPQHQKSVDAFNELYTNPRNQAEAAASARMDKGGFWNKALGITQGVIGEVPLVGPGLSSAINEGARGVEEKDPEAAAHGISSGVTQAAMLGAGGTKVGRAATEAALDSSLRKVTAPAMRVARETMGTALTPEAANAVRPEGAFQPALANVPKDVLNHAAQEGIDLTPFQASGSRVAGKLQVAGEHGIVGGQPLEEALNTNRAKFGEAVNRMSERIDPKRMGLSEEQAGESIKQSAQTAKDVAHTNAGDAYKNLPTQGVKVDPAPITQAWMKLRESLPVGIEDQIMSQVPRSMRAQVAEMLSPTGMKAPLNFEQAQALRSFFRDMGDAEGLPNRVEGAFKQMSKSADQAMESAAGKSGFEKEWREANQGWKDYAQKYGDKQSPLYKILRQADPAKVTRDLMNRASARDVEILKNEGMDSALEPLRRQVLQDIARNKFTVGRDGLGGYQDAFLQQLFGDTAKKELYLKADLARRMNWEPNPSGSGGQLLVGEQLGKPSKIAQLFGAAKLSMPRSATSYLPSTAGARPFGPQLSPGFLKGALAATREANQ